MKLNGVGAIKDPRTNKVIWDFEDGPFETEDQEIIEEQLHRGTILSAPDLVVSESDKEQLIEKVSSLGIGAPSTLRRWSVDRLEREIEAQEAE